MTVDALYKVLVQYRYTFDSEVTLQNALQDVMEVEGLAFTREHSLSTTDRIDFLVGNVGIEVKIKGGRIPLLMQLQRYASYDEITELLVQ